VLKPLNQHPFLLRNIQCWDLNTLSAALSSTNNRNSRTTTGNTIQILGCPYGTLAPFHFKKWLVKGIISNTIITDSATTNAALYLIDAKTLPGMEGSPVVTNTGEPSIHKSVNLLGTLLPQLRSSVAEANIVAPLDSILHAMLSLMMDTSDRIPLIGMITTADDDISRRGVVAVRERCSGSWASGIVMSSTGLILTVAHLLPPTVGRAHMQIEVGVRKVRSSSGGILSSSSSSSIHWLPARLMYKFTKAPHLDVAILQVKNDNVTGILYLSLTPPLQLH